MTTSSSIQPALVVEGLRVDLAGSAVNIVDDIGFQIAPGEILGLIGESGSGKTTVGSALLGFARPGTRIAAGSVRFGDVDILTLDSKNLRRQRGQLVTYVPQDPASSLNPARRIGAQLEEVLIVHGVKSRKERVARISGILEEVRLPSDKGFLARFPHELSGGQQQRVVIAAGFITNPRLVVLDEPTTGLDVSTQSHVLTMVRQLCSKHQISGLYVSHDLAVVAGLADRIAVMYHGRLVEVGPAEAVIKKAAHPYSRGLIGAVPDPHHHRALNSLRGQVAPIDERPGGCVFAERCDLVEPACRSQEIAFAETGKNHFARCRRTAALGIAPVLGAEIDLERTSVAERGRGFLSIQALQAYYGDFRVLKDVNLDVPKGLVTALVGESGSGKTTMARCIGGLHQNASGAIHIGGAPISFGSRARSAEERMAVQYIFQNATEALNPRRTIGDSIAEPMMTLSRCSRRDAQPQVEKLLGDVALNARYAHRYPSELSGGERQRATIARALATRPSILICDEITSALDVSVQASILLLLQKLQAENGLTLLFVTHNLGVVRAIADRVAVLNQGAIVEEGTVGEVLDSPQDSYTKMLLDHTPALSWAS